MALANDVCQYSINQLAMKPLLECRLYAFVDTAYLRGRAAEAVARELCLGGADLIQLRAKQSSLQEVREMALAVLQVTRSADVGLVINDHLAIGQEIGAEFCHLGQEDFFDAGHSHTSELAKLDSPGRNAVRIGLSTHAPGQAELAQKAGADYIAIGPVYATGTKPGARPVTLEYVRWAAANVKVPWFAIGGINLTNLTEVLAAGARRICVVSAILNSDDVVETCRTFKEGLMREA
jgi:thiamine-phosphate pyrophosphorylase